MISLPVSRPESIRAKARAREITLHSAILASALWAAVGADVISPGPLGRYSGFQKGNDFVSFYVSGSLARDGNFASLVDATRFHTAQIPFLPKGDTAFFPPLYGPQLALFFSPIARLPYLAAYAVWATITLALTFWSVSVLRRHVPSLAGFRWPVAMATAAYPPLAYLVLDGQISVLALVALSAAVVAISRGFHAAGGAMIGLLGYKISLVAPAIAVCVLAGEWTLAAAAFAVATLQLMLTVPIVGLDVVTGFLSNMASVARSPDVIVRSPFLMASFRTFWSALLPTPAATLAYILSAGLSVAIAAIGWRRSRSPVTRIGLLAIGIALAAPHLYIYDLVILAPAFVASVGILVKTRALGLRWCTWLAFLGPLAAPVAALTHVQLLTIVLATWLVFLAIEAPEQQS